MSFWSLAVDKHIIHVDNHISIHIVTKCFITFCSCDVAWDSPKGITTYSNCPYLALAVVEVIVVLMDSVQVGLLSQVCF
jgi:hypothetical protein